MGGSAFDITEARNFFLQVAEAEPFLTLRNENTFVKPIMQDNAVVGIVTEENGVQREYYGSRVIDGTVDADVAAAAGVPYTYAGEDIGERDRQMGVTLVFEPVSYTHLLLCRSRNLLYWCEFSARDLQSQRIFLCRTAYTHHL